MLVAELALSQRTVCGRSLAKLLAREEAAKARTAQKEGPYDGPAIRWRSKRSGEFAQVCAPCHVPACSCHLCTVASPHRSACTAAS